MRNDTTQDAGVRFAKLFWLAILFVSIVTDLLLCATTSHPYVKAVAFGMALFKGFALIAMLLSPEKKDTKGGRGKENHTA